MSHQNKNLGAIGEKIAADTLLSKGYQIIHKNYRAPRYGEVDIIATKGELIIFVEVKTRMSEQFGMPEEAITPHKLHELRKMIDFFLSSNSKITLSPQIDVIAIELNTDLGVNSLLHFENVTL